MPLPLPNLDNRRWPDLVEEGRALIPRYAPDWTDHNIHDPGITLIELFAWLVEQVIFRVNRIPQSHYRKFLALTGTQIRGARPAQAALTFSYPNSPAALITLPAGIVAAPTDAPDLPLRTLHEITVNEAQIVAVQTFDGAHFRDVTRQHQGGLPFQPFGSRFGMDHPRRTDDQPALYIGFDRPLLADETFSLWIALPDPVRSLRERTRLRQQAEAAADPCEWPPRPRPCHPCEPDNANEAQNPAPAGFTAVHHSVRVVWEFWYNAQWATVSNEDGEISDDTAGLTLDGSVRLTLPAVMQPIQIGGVIQAHHYLRCRMVAGPPDAVPVIARLLPNTVAAEQRLPAGQEFIIEAGASAPNAVNLNAINHLQVRFDDRGRIIELGADPDEAGIDVYVADYQQPLANAAGYLIAVVRWVGTSSGLPGMVRRLPQMSPVDGQIGVWVSGENGITRWEQRPDFDTSQRTSSDFMLDVESGEISFGDGARGRVPPYPGAMMASYEVTAGARAASTADAYLLTDGFGGAINHAMLGAMPDLRVRCTAMIGGEDAETFDQAVGRVVERLWAHERLVELCERASCTSLDQIDRSRTLAIRAPERAATLPDFERLALDVPGTHIARVRAWAGVDIATGCANLPGTVTVVIMPELPAERPEPSPGLIRAVRGYLSQRKVLGTRLVVTGPDYVEISVNVTVRAKRDYAPDIVRQQVEQALYRYLHPLTGGTKGCGWPFGRDVYVAELLQVIDELRGVDHVTDLEIETANGAQCSNICLRPTQLVLSGTHHVTVTEGSSR